MSRHVHADLMIAYANDASLEIEHYSPSTDKWSLIYHPGFYPTIKYRIKPKPDYEKEADCLVRNPKTNLFQDTKLKFVYNGQTNVIKSVELMK